MDERSQTCLLAQAWVDFKHGLLEGPRVFFAPVRPRLWRYVVHQTQTEGWRTTGPAIWKGMDLLIEARLDRHGNSIRN